MFEMCRETSLISGSCLHVRSGIYSEDNIFSLSSHTEEDNVTLIGSDK